MGKATAASIQSGSGMFEGPCLIKEAQFNTRSNFGGQLKVRVTALELLLEYLDGSKLAERKIYMTVNKFGKSTWKASEDGEDAANEGNFLFCEKDENISDGTSFGAFQKSLFDKSFEYEGGAIDAEQLQGLKCVLIIKDAPTPEKPDRKLNVVSEILEELPWNEDGTKTGKAAKPKFEKNGKVPKDVADDDEEDAEDEDDDDEDADEAEESDDADEGVDKATVLSIMTAVMAANKKGVKLKALQTPVFAVIASKFKKLATQRKAVAAACAEFVESGAKNKVFTYDEDSGLISAK